MPRLKPRIFYDLVIQVAIVRPGPIQGDMVHPYLRRRDGREKPDYPKPEFAEVLRRTLGVPIFQEQAMQVAIACAGFTANEADQLRRAMATFKNVGTIQAFHEKLVGGHGEERLCGRIRRTYLQAVGRFRLLRLSREPCGLLRQDRLCLLLAQMPSPGCVLCGPSQCPTHGLLRACPDRARCAGARSGGTPGFNQQKPLGLHAGTVVEGGADSSPCGWELRMVRGLANEAAAALVNARITGPYRSIDDLWRPGAAFLRRHGSACQCRCLPAGLRSFSTRSALGAEGVAG